MEKSPAGRTIENVEGSPDEIETRGDAITDLGERMKSSADVLEAIATRSSEQQGLAIDKLVETIDEAYTKLREAGELYEPVGPVIATYGKELGTIQPKLNGHVSTCESLWTTYVSLPGDADGDTDGGESPEEKTENDENAAKKQAYEDWEEEAGSFDSEYDTWEEAYDTAVSGITDSMSGKIQDGWTEFLSMAKDILSIAGLILGIAAIIIGGPIVGALAAVVAVLTLVVVGVQFARGEATLIDLGLAIIDVIPIGKIGGKLIETAGWGKDAFKAMSGGVGSEIIGQFGPLFKKGEWGVLASPKTWGGGGSMMTRLMTGKGVDFFETMGNQTGRELLSSLFQMQHSMGSAGFKVASWFTKAFGVGDARDALSVDVGDSWWNSGGLPLLRIPW